MKTKQELGEQLSLLRKERFSLTEELRINSVSNAYNQIVDIKKKISDIDIDINEILNTKYKDMK